MIVLLLLLGGCAFSVQFPPVHPDSPCMAIGTDTGTPKLTVEVPRGADRPLCLMTDF